MYFVQVEVEVGSRIFVSRLRVCALREGAVSCAEINLECLSAIKEYLVRVGFYLVGLSVTDAMKSETQASAVFRKENLGGGSW